MISAAQARVLSDEYSTKNYRVLNVGKSEPETKDVYYEFEVLQDYINYVKSKAKKKKSKILGYNSLRAISKQPKFLQQITRYANSLFKSDC